MLAVAAEELAGGSERVTLVESDLTTARLPEPVDAVFSNATFHWIWDHDALFANLAALMKPGARLSAQCGGAGCIDRMVRYAESVMARAPFSAYPRPGKTYNFVGPEETRARMRAAGFADVETWLEDQPAAFPDADAFGVYLKTIVLGPYLGVLPAELHDAFAAAVVEEDARDGGRRTVDYVRLNMTGRRAG
jgi:trans-aconitate 2-methyltransferase